MATVIKGQNIVGKTIYPNGKLCKCGCGNPAAKNIAKDGRDKGWYKYANGHQPRPPFCDPIVRAKAIATARTKIPIGTRRLHDTGHGHTLYWVIKTDAPGRWPFEHRYIMEQRLGRKLRSDEHVHHRDGNGLNNGLHNDGQSNLVVLSASDHCKLTSKENPPEYCRCVCPDCGANSYHIKKIHHK